MINKIISFKHPFQSLELDLTTNCTAKNSLGDPLPCAKNCTYYHSKGFRYVLGLNDATQILKRAHQLGIHNLVFSGGGEPLEHPSPISIFAKAKEFGFKTNLLTNGMFLDSYNLKDLLASIDLLRISIPTAANYDHILNFKKSLTTINKLERKPKVIFSVPIMPETTILQIERIIKYALRFRLDAVRLKPTHILHGKSFLLEINNYKKIFKNIKIYSRSKHTAITFAKFKDLFSLTDSAFKNCSFRDYNLTIGANGYLYSCCETKYLKAHELGHYRDLLNKDLPKLFLQNPQQLTSHCFKGCKGWIHNVSGKHRNRTSLEI
ncbi:radical SAM protein [Candidatus Margulisiibacteriota bacterium]